MKRRIRSARRTVEVPTADHQFEKQIAKNTAQLRRINRFLQTVTECNWALIRATKDLLRGVVRDAGQLAELRRRYDSLTPRERQVMALVVKGLINKQTAAHLGTAEITVKIQRASVMKKMQAESIADLVRMAEKLQIVTGI